MQEVKREHLNLDQIAKSQNIPYCKLYHVYLMLGSIPEAVKVCRKNWKHLEHYKQYLREWKKKPRKPKEPKPLSEIAKENGIPLGCLMQRLEKMSLKEALKKPLARGVKMILKYDL